MFDSQISVPSRALREWTMRQMGLNRKDTDQSHGLGSPVQDTYHKVAKYNRRMFGCLREGGTALKKGMRGNSKEDMPT